MFNLEKRPASLSEVCGHKFVVKDLESRFVSGDIPHYILLAGPTGLGKTTLERIIAKRVKCKDLQQGHPCNRCESCVDIDEERNNLGHYVYKASDMNIEEMREFESATQRRSMIGGDPVHFIDEFQELYANKKASKYILDIIEKKKPGYYIILGTMDLSRVDKAIRDRCKTYILSPLSIAEIGPNLVALCNEAGVEVDADKKKVLLAIAQYAEGSMRAARNKLEDVIRGSIWNTEDLIHIGVVPPDTAADLTTALLVSDAKTLFAREITEEVLRQIRYTLVLKIKHDLKAPVPPYELDRIRKLPAIPVARLQSALAKINTINTFNFIDKVLIESILLSIIEAK